MSFIDYNFFPILFFLGWNILTTKQFRPTVYSTLDSKTLPALSVFSLTDSINQKTLESNSKNYQKKSNILEFVPKFLFLSENQKLIGIPQANTICSEKQTKDTYMFKKTLFKRKISQVYRKKMDNLNYVAKPTKWLQNEERTHYFVNYNRVNHNWEENFKSNPFNFTYRPKRKRFLSSFFNYNQEIKPTSRMMESRLNLGSMFSDMAFNLDSSEFVKSSWFENDIFFGGLCSCKNNIGFWKKAQKKLDKPVLKTGVFSQTSDFFKAIPQAFFFTTVKKNAAPFNDTHKKGVLKWPDNLFCFKNPIKNPPVVKNDVFKHQIASNKTQETIRKNGYNDFNLFLQDSSSFLTVKTDTSKLNNINSILKRRLKIRVLLRVPNQKIYSLNHFQMALYFSKMLQPPIFFHDNPRLNLAFSSWAKGECLENKDAKLLKTSTNHEFPKLDNSMLSYIKNEFELQTQVLKTGFLDNNRFENSDQETGYIDKYKQKKKNWYMKTQFFQHIAWNMKHQIFNGFSDIEYLLHTNNLFIKTSHGFVIKPFQLLSYQNKNNFLEETKNDNVSINSKNVKTFWLNDFSEKPKRSLPLRAHTFCQNYFLRIYGGSWYYENLAFPYSSFNTIHLTPSITRQFEPVSIFDHWYKTFFKGVPSNQESVIRKKRLLESKQFALAWFYARKHNILKNFRYWPYPNKFACNNALLNKKTQLENRFESDSIPLADSPHPGFIHPCGVKRGRVTLLNRFNSGRLNHSYNYKRNPFSAKSQTKLESDIGIYSLAHKLSSVGFRNGNSEIDIYPFKYNDSYGYNFQNMNLSNQRFADFLGLSSLNNQTRNASVLSQKNTNPEQDNFNISKRIPFSNYKTFLDFQNPIVSKIYAPLYQPKNLNVLSFLANSFLNIIPNSIINSQPTNRFGFFGKKTETTHLFSLNKIEPVIKLSLHDLKGMDRPLKTIPVLDENFRVTPKKSKMLNALYPKLPINGIHANPYPWITQNAFDRWSSSNRLSTFVSDAAFLKRFSETESDYSQINNLLKKKFVLTRNINDSYKTPAVFNHQFFKESSLNHTEMFLSKTSSNTNRLMPSQKQSSKRFNSQLHFTEKLSCIKKPSIFFSSFRHLPYFLISETLSKNNMAERPSIFPQANLSLSALVNSPNYKLEKLTKNSYSNFLISPGNHHQYYLFQDRVLKENQKKQIQEPLSPYFLQHKSFSNRELNTFNSRSPLHSMKLKWRGLKPLSTFIKKEIGYHTSLFSWIPPTKIICSENQTNDISTFKKPVLMPKSSKCNKNILKFWSESKEKPIQKMDFIPIKKNSWKVFPPLFQPLTFRFSDLNLPRTWSSELVSSIFNSKAFNTKHSKCLNTLEKNEIEKKPFGSYPISSANIKEQTEPCWFPACRKPTTSSGEKQFFSRRPIKWNMTQKNFFGFSIPFYFSDFFRFSINENASSNTKSALFINNYKNHENTSFYELAFPFTDFSRVDKHKQSRNNNHNSKLKKKNEVSMLNETPKFQNSKIIVYGEKPILKNRTAHGPPLKNQKESISLPSYLKNITNQNYQNLCPNDLNELYFVFWILFNKTLFIYLSLHYLRKFISFLGTEYIRNLFKIFVTMKFIDGNILSIIKTFQDFNFQLNQQNVIDIKVNKQLKNIKRN